MKIKIFNAAERLVLISAINSSSGSLLSLRKDTHLGLDAFIGAIQTLEQRLLLTRDVGRFKVLPAALKWLTAMQTERDSRPTDEYLASVSVPKLAVTEFFIPNKEVFLKDIRNSR
jgi:hypothetical protein